MQCPECLKEGKKSTVYDAGCSTTLMATQHYWDEDGKEHYSDPNTTTCNYRCSNGHSFSQVLPKLDTR